jgi:hypothetical protein
MVYLEVYLIQLNIHKSSLHGFFGYYRIVVNYSSVSTVTRLRTGRQGFDCRQGQEIFLFAKMSSPGLGPI